MFLLGFFLTGLLGLNLARGSHRRQGNTGGVGGYGQHPLTPHPRRAIPCLELLLQLLLSLLLLFLSLQLLLKLLGVLYQLLL